MRNEFKVATTHSGRDLLHYFTIQVESSQPPGLSFGLEEREDVSLSDGSLDVADDLSVLFPDELHLDLGTLALGAGTAEHLDDASEGDLVVHAALICKSEIVVRL